MLGFHQVDNNLAVLVYISSNLRNVKCKKLHCSCNQRPVGMLHHCFKIGGSGCKLFHSGILVYMSFNMKHLHVWMLWSVPIIFGEKK